MGKPLRKSCLFSQESCSQGAWEVEAQEIHTDKTNGCPSSWRKSSSVAGPQWQARRCQVVPPAWESGPRRLK